MKFTSSLIVALFIFILAQPMASCSSSDPITPNETFEFRSAKEKTDTEYKARHGDAKAANRMAQYCYFIEGNRKKAIYWYKIAASYGDKVARENAKKLGAE
jgi:TPR repeat protein